MPLLWLSFVKDDKFAGVVVTEADGIAEATAKCWRNGVNPGGEVMCYEIPEGATKERGYPRDTLLSEAFLKADGHKKIKDLPPEMQEMINGS